MNIVKLQDDLQGMSIAFLEEKADGEDSNYPAWLVDAVLKQKLDARQKAELAAARKSVSKRGSSKNTAKPVPPKRLPPPLQHVSAPVANDAKSTASAAEKTSKPQQQQHVHTTAAMPTVKAVQPIQPALEVPVNSNVKMPLPQPHYQRNLSNAG